MAKTKYYPPIGFGERLSTLMYERNMHDGELASRIGCERKSILSYRHNEKAPNITQLMKMCYIFNVSADFMIFGRGRKWQD